MGWTNRCKALRTGDIQPQALGVLGAQVERLHALGLGGGPTLVDGSQQQHSLGHARALKPWVLAPSAPTSGGTKAFWHSVFGPSALGAGQCGTLPTARGCCLRLSLHRLLHSCSLHHLSPPSPRNPFCLGCLCSMWFLLPVAR